MNSGYIMCSSITYAHKGHDILIKYGISSRVVRPPKQIGCGYSLELDLDLLQKASMILRENGVKLDRRTDRR